MHPLAWLDHAYFCDLAPRAQDEAIVNQDPIDGGYYGAEWPMLWPPPIHPV